MRDDTLGIFAAHEAASPEAQKSMKMAELQNLMEYRARRSAAFADWVKPENIAKRKLEHEEAAAKALEVGLALAAEAKRQIAVAAIDKEMRKLNFKVKPLLKIIHKSWWRRLLEWLRA